MVRLQEKSAVSSHHSGKRSSLKRMKEVALLSEKRCHLVSFGVISKGMIEKIVKSGLCYQDLNQFMKNAEDKIQALRSVRTTIQENHIIC